MKLKVSVEYEVDSCGSGRDIQIPTISYNKLCLETNMTSNIGKSNVISCVILVGK